MHTIVLFAFDVDGAICELNVMKNIGAFHANENSA
jgi:hypothetical protein